MTTNSRRLDGEGGTTAPADATDDVAEHLTAALTAAEDSTTRFHIREAMQLLEGERS